MHRKKFIFMFVAWYCVNTMNGSPISFENKLDCGIECKTDGSGIEINDHQWNLQQAGDLNLDVHLPAFTGRVIPKRRKRQTNNDPSGVTASSPETTIAPAPIEATTQTDSDEQSTEVPFLRKDEIDLTDSAEYKRAQENLLSASEQVKVKDVQIAPGDGISSDDKILPNTNFPAASIQDIKEVETAENIIPKNDSTSSNSSTTNPVSSMTEISMEIKGTVSKSAEDVAVKYDGVIESGSLSGDIPVASENTTADPTAETKPEAYNLSKSGTSAEKTGPKLNTTHANADMEYSTPMGDTKNRALLEDLIKNKLNALVTDPVKRGEVEAQEKLTENAFNAVVKSNETGGDSFPNSIDSKSNPKTVSIPGELHHNVTDEDDSVRLDTTQKLDFEAEQLETEDVKKDKDISVIPNSPTTSPNAGTSKENHHKNHNDSETHEDNNFVNQYESHIYDLDDWDDDFTDTSSFDDFTENPCDCSRTETPNNYDSFVENDPTVSIEYPPIEPCVEHFHPPDYSTNYGDADVDHSQHTDDNTSDFPDDFDSEDLDDLLNSDVEFITNGDNNCDHFDEDTDDFAF